MGSKDSCFIGIDVGSISVNTIIINDKQEILEEYYTRTHGQPLITVHRVLEEILSRLRPSQVLAILGLQTLLPN